MELQELYSSLENLQLNRQSGLWTSKDFDGLQDNWNKLEAKDKEIILKIKQAVDFIKGNANEAISTDEIQKLLKDWLAENKFVVKESVLNIEDLPADAQERELRGVDVEQAAYIFEDGKWIKFFSMQNIEELRKSIEEIRSFLQTNTDDIANLKTKTEENETGIQDLNSQLQDKEYLITENERKINELSYNVSKQYVNAEKYTDLQEAINAAAGKTLILKSGVYLINKTLRVKSNTRIIGYNATFKRNANINALMINDSDGTKGGYSANSNIKIVGLTFDGSKGSFSDQCTLLAFGHCENIEVTDCRFKDLADWNMLALNAVKDAKISGCYFSNYGSESIGTEMVQIDTAKSSSVFVWFGLYDNTTCENITIKNCNFKDGVKAIATQSYNASAAQTNISIIDNVFTNMNAEAISTLNWSGVTIERNRFNNVLYGVLLSTNGRVSEDYAIKNNNISGKPLETSRGIFVKGNSDNFGVNRGTIANNFVKNCGGQGISIDYSDNWSISNNDVTKSGRSGIVLYGATNILVSNNTTFGNATTVEVSGNTDIRIIGSGTRGILAIGNIGDKFEIHSNVAASLATGNVYNSLVVAGSSNKSFNNMVKGVWVN